MGDPHLWRGFQTLVEELQRHGVPKPSQAWLTEVERHYLTDKRTWTACCGRGSGKNLVGIPVRPDRSRLQRLRDSAW